MFDKLGASFSLANFAHCEQIRKWSGDPYIVHPVRVCNMLGSTYNSNMEKYIGLSLDDMRLYLCVCLLHDAYEDNVDDVDKSSFIMSTIQTLDMNIWNGVSALTNESVFMPKETSRNIKKEKDFKKIRTLSSPLKIIKMLDRLDNLYDSFRGGVPPSFMKKYLPESVELASICEDADKAIASKIVETCETLEREGYCNA